jgi:tetratricopeptide (TPR) repeat protein
VLLLSLLFPVIAVHAQTQTPTRPETNPVTKNNKPSDDLLRHLSAAETYQISGDLANAAVENRAVAAIALQRIGNLAVEEGKFPDAARILGESLKYADTAANRTNLAVAYLRQDQTEKAIEEIRRAIALDPAFPGARYILGNIYFNKEDYAAALPELEKVLQLAPDFETAHALGLTYLYLKQPERARLLFEEMQISAGKDTADLHLLFARAYERTNYPLEAERELKRALQIEPKLPRASFYLGYLILQNGGSERIADAGLAFEQELKLDPNDFFANFFAGVVASSNDSHQKALAYLNKAIGLNPKSSEAFLFLAQSQQELGDLPGAEKSLRRAVELEALDTKGRYQARRTHFMLGRLLLRTGRKEEGEKELEIAAKLQQESLVTARDEINRILGQVVGETNRPAAAVTESETAVNVKPERSAEIAKIRTNLVGFLAQALYNLGVISVQTGQTSDALEKFAAAAAWRPDFPNLDRSWGIVSFRSGQFAQSVAPLTRHLRTRPDDRLARQMLGISHYFGRDFAKAAETLKPLEPTIVADAELAYFYGISLVELKRAEEALSVFQRLSDVSQASPDSLSYAAQGFMLSGDLERALKDFTTLAAIDPRRPKTNYFIGQSLIRLNRFDEAEKAFARELEINPADHLAQYHLALTLIERKVEPERALVLLRQAIDLKYDYADARYQLGKIHLENGETQKAIEQLESASVAEPNKDYIRYQLSIAYRKVGRTADADRELKRYQELKAANRKTDSPM